MNDFTKEELVYIQQSIKNTWYGADVLWDKIQSMIDNYCEHENDRRFNALPTNGSPKFCTKCEMFYI